MHCEQNPTKTLQTLSQYHTKLKGASMASCSAEIHSLSSGKDSVLCTQRSERANYIVVLCVVQCSTKLLQCLY